MPATSDANVINTNKVKDKVISAQEPIYMHCISSV